MTVTLKPHQREAADKLSNGKILFGLPGSGKTHAALGYYVDNEAPKPLYVITTARKRDDQDWQVTASHFSIFPPESPGYVGTIVVDSWNNIEKYIGVTDGFFIFDEQRLVGSGAWVKAFYKIAKKNTWIMLSGTPGDTWLDYVPVFVANGFYRNKSHFVDEHVRFKPYVKFPKVDRYLATGKLIRLRESIIVAMPFERHTTRHIKHVLVDYDKGLFLEVLKNRWHVYKNRPLKNVAELFGVMRKVVNSDESRIRALADLMEQHSRLIVFYNFDYELEMLRSLAGSWSMDSSSPTTPSMLEKDAPNGDGAKTTRPGPTGVTPGPVELLSPESKPNAISARKESELCLESRDRSGTEVSTFPWKSTSHTNSTSTSLQTTSSTTPSRTMPASERSSTKSSTDECERTTSASTRRSSTKPCSKQEPSQRSVRTTSNETLEQSSIPEKTRKGSGSQSNSMKTTSGDIGAKSGVECCRTPIGAQPVTIAEWNGHRHDPVPEGERWIYLVQYAAGAEAWNCTTTDAMVFYSMTYSYKLFDQSMGRIDRLNTPFTDLYYYVFRSNSLIDKAIWKSLENKRSFNESSFAEELSENA